MRSGRERRWRCGLADEEEWEEEAEEEEWEEEGMHDDMCAEANADASGTWRFAKVERPGGPPVWKRRHTLTSEEADGARLPGDAIAYPAPPSVEPPPDLRLMAEKRPKAFRSPLWGDLARFARAVSEQ